MRSSVLAQCLRVLGVVLLLGLCVNGVWLPSPRGEETPATEVSESRAREHLEVIASEPHATGTEAAKRVREYLCSELESLGIETELIRGSVDGVEVVDILARIPGRGEGGVLLFACHYDSVDRGERWRGPGAGDDGAAVASLLETARALTAGGPLKNEIWLLFTDGEELGLYGAKLFCRDEARVEPIDVVFNFEGIGNNGPSVMFQTSPGNARLIDEFARVECTKVAPSFAQAIYERMPNDTDFTVFVEHGLIGLNFAIVGGRSAYHRPFDSVENLTAPTLQYQAEAAHALALHFGELDLATLRAASDQLYFDLYGRTFAHFTPAANYGLFALGVLALVNWLWRSRQRGIGLVRGSLAALRLGLYLAFLLLGLVAVLAMLSSGLQKLFEPVVVQRGDGLSAFLFGWGCMSFGFAVLLGWLASIQRVEKHEAKRILEPVLGGSLLWFALCVLALSWLPIGSYFATLPLVVAVTLAPHFANRVLSGRTSWIAALGSACVIVLLAQDVGLIVALTSDSRVVSAIVCGVAVALGAPLCLPLAHWLRVRDRAPLLLSHGIAIVLLLSSSVLRVLGL